MKDPFRFMGNYEGRLQDLWDALDDWTGDSTSGYEGFFRARNGNSIIEIASYPLSYKDNYWLQVVKGKLKVTNNGELTSATNYNVVSRVHNYGQVGWSSWELIAGGDLKKEIADLITAEQERATAKEQELTDKFSTLMGGVPDAVLDTIKEIADWLLNDETGTQAIINKIGANTDAIDVEIARAKEKENSLEEKIAKEKAAIVNGDTIAGQAREIYSRTGKTDSATFLERTTAGGTSISDGVASVKQIGGNIVKNLVSSDGTYGWKSVGDTAAISQANGIYTIQDVKGAGYCTISWNGLLDDAYRVNGHAYYYSCNVKAKNIIGNDVIFGIANNVGSIYRTVAAKSDEKWQSLSFVATENVNKNYYGYALVDIRADRTTPLYAKDFLCIDLTEMFGAGNEPTKEECDKMFGAMGALPQGLTIAQPTGLKSTGYNQWNPTNIIKDKTITNNAITDLAGSNIAIVECLPCAVGAGENNGYVIGYGEGDDWSDEGVEVYLTPLNPMEVEGELYMHKLEKDSTYGTYVPQIKGYMLVVTPVTDKLCAHFHWSGDRVKTDYEEYIESNVSIPTIPQMSEWGLAGISASGTLACDTIDLDRMVYTKRVGCFDGGSILWNYDETFQGFIAANAMLTIRVESPFVTNKYPYVGVYNNVTDKTIGYIFNRRPFIKDSSYGTDTTAFKASLQGVMFYYELAEPEEYPIVTKAAPNYIGNDYGVEKWLGSQVPLSANILFYMRSLVGETRNFLDQLAANTNKSDTTEIADYITESIANNSKKADDAVTLALRQLFIAAGAVYNASTGYYELNGITNLTEADMTNIYAYKDYVHSLDMPRIFQLNKKARTFFPINVAMDTAGQTFRDNPLDGTASFYSTSLEVIKFMSGSSLNSAKGDAAVPIRANSTTLYSTFAESKKLRVIYPIKVSSVNNFGDSFYNCLALEELRLLGLKANINIAQSSLISKDSILYIINNAEPTTAITITLHADAYARLANDADIVAALAAQPLVTLVSA